MGLFDQFPYTNFHELNLDWILKALKELEHTIDQFVAINALKYADPIQWDITCQYEKNTIVIDPQTGTAYISVEPVPIGVALTNPDYWTVVFDLGSFVVRAAKNLAITYEAETTLTATVSTPAGGWLVWGDTLYKANVNITAGDSYVEGGNITHFTIEDMAGHLDDLTTTTKANLVAAINEVLSTLASTTGDLADLTTTDKSNLVAAINEVASQVLGKIGDLDDLDTTDKSNLVAAINEVLSTLASTTGDLADLTTTDKSNLVAAINEEIQARQDADSDLQDAIDDLASIKVFFNTVAEMKATATLEDGNIAVCSGYYTKNDGGAALYSISDTASSDGLYETLDNGLYANIIVEDATINVLQLGAKLNDSTFDNSTIFQKAVESKYNITIPAPNVGVYYMSNQVEIHDLYFKNINAESSNIVYTGTGAAFKVRACHNCIWKFGRITCNDASASCFQFIAETEFDNFVDRIDFYFSELQAGTNAVGIDFEAYAPSFINEIHVYNGVLAKGYYGVLVRNNTASSMNGFHFHNIQVEGVKYGFSFNNDGISHPIMDISIENPRTLDMGSGNKFLRTQGYNQGFYIQSASPINVSTMCEIYGTLNNVLFDCPNVNNNDADYRMPAVYRNNELLGANMYTRDVTADAGGNAILQVKNGQCGLILIYKDLDVGSSVVGSSADVGIYVFGCYGNRASIYPIHAAADVTISVTNMVVTVTNANTSHAKSIHLISTFD